jgi:hypothetical protein
MTRLWVVLTAALAATYLFVGVFSSVAGVRWAALAGALLLVAGLGAAGRSRVAALVLVALGALVPAVLGWWSLVLPLTGLLALVCGALAVRARAHC